jgi:fructoselysine 6-kinase
VDKIFCVGDLCIDHYPELHKSFIGGCSYNLAKHLNDLKAKVTLISPIGMDQWSGQISDKLESENLNFQVLKRRENNLVLNIEVIEGERHFKDFQDEILKNFSWKKDELRFLDNSDYIVSPYFEEIRAVMDPVIKSFGDKVILDLHDCVGLSLQEVSDLLSRVKILHLGDCSFEDAELEDLVKQRGKMISRTLGSKGSVLYTAEGCYRSESIESREIVDTIGAGDAYLARFIYGLTNGEPIQTLLDCCNEFAASTLLYHGATRGAQL